MLRRKRMSAFGVLQKSLEHFSSETASMRITR